jgi:predicted GNAT superfamily acetyltransferase
VTSEAWALAERAADAAGVELRPLRSLEDCDAILEVMIATWGDHQTIPREMIRALGESGNVPYGAVAGQELIGYVLGWAGVDPHEGLHLHSHMLATLPDRRHRGVGYALKLAQRAQGLEQGISVARWTFDPLVARNAYFNLHKLGAVADRFERNFYGEMTDALNRGERSDRFVIRWDLEREPEPRVFDVDAPEVIDEEWNFVGLPPEAERGVLVRVPADLLELRERNPELAARCRDAVADAIEAGMAAGLVAVGFHRDEGVSGYVMAKEPAR